MSMMSSMEDHDDQTKSSLPPGFRFHPTEEELVGYYLTRKINSLEIDLNVIVEIDLYRMEPWDIQDRLKLGYGEQSEWYFFSHKDKKYPTGTRTHRATGAGFWKATGRDKAIVSRSRVVGMRKTLVFYQGRAPNGRKTDWIMHEYRLQRPEHEPPPQDGEWVVCRAFRKSSPIPNQRVGFEAWNQSYSSRDYSSSVSLNSHDLTFHHHVSQQNEIFSSRSTFSDDHQPVGLPQLDCEEERFSSGTCGQYIDFKDHDVDEILASTTSELTSHGNFALGDNDHVGYFLGCFPDS